MFGARRQGEGMTAIGLITEPGERIPREIYSPLRVRLLLHCAVSPNQPVENFGMEAIGEDLADLVQLGAIEEHGSDRKGLYRATPLGMAWATAICNVKIPRMVFLDEAGRELEAR